MRTASEIEEERRWMREQIEIGRRRLREKGMPENPDERIPWLYRRKGLEPPANRAAESQAQEKEEAAPAEAGRPASKISSTSPAKP